MLGVLVRKCAVTGAALMAIAIASVGASAAQADVVQRGAATSSGTVASSFRLDDVAITAGSGRLLVVGVATTEGQQVTGVTYGGQALTLRAARDSGATRTTGAHAELWTLSDPAVGTAAVVVRFAHNVSAVVGAAAYDGADALNPVQAVAEDVTGDGSNNVANPVISNTPGDADFGVLAVGNVSNLNATPVVGPSTDTVTATSLWGTTAGSQIFGAAATRGGNTGANRATSAGVAYHWGVVDSNAFAPHVMLMAGLNRAATAIRPTVDTDGATGVTTGGGTLNGHVISDGGGTITQRGFVVCAAPCIPALGSGTEVDAAGTGVGAFSATAGGLDPNKSYDYRAFASNAAGTSYGADVTFRTLSANHAPVAGAGGPYTIGEGNPLALDASGSTDADGDALTYRWDLDGDGQYDDATGARPSLSAAQAATFGMGDGPATHAVAVQASDPSGARSTASADVTVTNRPPALTPSGVPAHAVEGTPWTLHVSATDPSAADTAAGLRYGVDTDDDGTWDYGDDVYASATTATDITITPTDYGPQTVDVQVTDKDGGNTYVSIDYDVDNVAPTATLSTGGAVGEGSAGSVRFSGQSDPSSADTAAGFHYAYDLDGDGTWDVGDGTYAGSASSSSAAVPTTDNGMIRVRAAIIDKDGDSTTYNQTLTVDNVAPDGTVANGGPVDEGSIASVSVSGATDPSTADTAAGLHYAYDIGDDGSWDFGLDTTYARSTMVDHIPVPTTDDGTTPVRVAIIDKDGGVTTHVTNVVATGVAPTATFDNDGPVDEGSDLTVSLTAPTDPSSADTAAGFHYAYDTNDDGNWDVGDGTYGGSGSDASLRIPMTDSGRFFIRARIIDKDGLSTGYRMMVTADDVAPVASVAAPDRTPLDTDLQFTVGASDAGPDDQAALFTYRVDWGDGTAPLRQNGQQSMIALHRFTTAGTYTVTVTAADKDGGISAPVTVTVTIPAPPAPVTTTTTPTTTTTTPPAPVTAQGAVTPLLAKVQGLTVSPRCVAAAAATSRAVRIRYRLSTAATVRVTLQRSTGSRAVATCPPLRGSQQDDGRYKPGSYAPVSVRQTRGSAGACSTSLTIAKGARGGAVGSVATVRPQALIAKGGKLAPGTYLLTVTTLSADGRVQDTARVKFWVLKAKAKATRKAKAKA
jgi:hypothetical protein